MEIDPKKMAVVYIIGVLLSFAITGINSLFALVGLTFVWTTLLGIVLSGAVFPFIYGAIAHLIDNFLMGQDIDLDDHRIIFPIWIVGVVLSFIVLIVNSFLQLFGLTLDWSTLPNILVTLLLFPWFYGTIAHKVDERLTE